MRGLSAPILRGILLATVALVMVIAFLRIEFRGTPQPLPAWTPTEAQRIRPAPLPEPSAAPGQPPEQQPQPQPLARRTANRARNLASNAAQPEHISPAGRSTQPQSHEQAPSSQSDKSGESVAGQDAAAADDLDAPPPPPGQRASASKPEEEKARRKRLLHAVGKVFGLGKKPVDEKVVPSAHHPN